MQQYERPYIRGVDILLLLLLLDLTFCFLLNEEELVDSLGPPPHYSVAIFYILLKNCSPNN